MDIKKINKELTKLIEAWDGQSNVDDDEYFMINYSFEDIKKSFWDCFFGDGQSDYIGDVGFVTTIKLAHDLKELYFGGRLAKFNIIEKLKTNTPLFDSFFGNLPQERYTDYWNHSIWADGLEGEKFVRETDKGYLLTDLKGLVDMYKEAVDKVRDARGQYYYMFEQYFFDDVVSKLKGKLVAVRAFVSQLDKIIDEEILPISEYNIAVLEKYLPAFD